MPPEARVRLAERLLERNAPFWVLQHEKDAPLFAVAMRAV